MRFFAIFVLIAAARAQESAAGLHRRALAMQMAGSYQEAAGLYAQAVTAWERIPGSSAGELAAALAGLGHVYTQLGRLEEGEVALRRALAAGEAVYGLLSGPLILIRSQLGWVLLLRGDQWGAEAELARAAALAREAKMPARDQAPILVTFASLRIQQGRPSEAAALLEQAPFDPAAVIELAKLYRLQGNTARAALLLRRAEVMIEELHGPTHPELARVWGEQALVLLADHHPVRAAALLEQALHVLSVALGPNHVEVARLKHNLAVSYIAQNRYTAAEPLLSDALARMHGQEHAIVLSKLAYLYRCLQRQAEAASSYTQAIAEFSVSAPADPEFARTLQEYARLIGRSNRQEARQLEQRAKMILGHRRP